MTAYQSDDFKNIARKIGRYWLIYPVCILAFLAIGVLYNKMAEPVYEIGARMVVHETNRNEVDPSRFLMGSELFSTRNTFQNSLLTLQARPLLEKIFEKINLNVFYYRKHWIYDENLYNYSPFQVVIDPGHLQMTSVNYEIKILSETEYILSVDASAAMLHDFQQKRNERPVDDFVYSERLSFGKTVEHENFKFTVLLKEGIDLRLAMNDNLFFVLKSNAQLVHDFKSNLIVEPADVQGTAINVTFIANNHEQGRDFLNTYVSTVIEDNLARKNYIALSTIDYIDRQLSIAYDSLNIAEQSLQDFKTQKQVIDVSMKASQIYDNIRVLESERDRVDSHVRYLEVLNDKFRGDSDFTEYSVTVISDLNNQVLNDLLNEYITFVNRKNHLIENKQEKSPQLKDLVFQIKNLKNTILVNLSYTLDAARIDLQRLQSKMGVLNSELNRLPGTQRSLVSFERNFKLTDATYTYLMEKRSEAQIAKASNLPDYEVFDFPAVEGKHSPKESRNIALAIFLGFLLPTIFILLYESFFEKIADQEDYSMSFKIPLLGQIYKSPDEARSVFDENSDHVMTAESFRKLRTNLGFWNWPDSDNGRMILITSTVPGEGKTFCSFNLAQALSMLGKKTVLVDLDLRKGDLTANYFTSPENQHGVSEYLSGQSDYKAAFAKMDKQKLMFIPSGPLPPNPSELIDSEACKNFFEALKNEFDYVVVDSAPITVSAEGISLSGLSDLVLLVARVNHTLKREFKLSMAEMESAVGRKLSVLLNAVRISRSNYSNYVTYYKRKEKR